MQALPPKKDCKGLRKMRFKYNNCIVRAHIKNSMPGWA